MNVRQMRIDFTSVEGRRSSQSSGRAILREAVAPIDGSTADDIDSTKDWRKGYVERFREVVVAGALSAKNALALAENGLSALHQHVVACGPDGDVALRSALASGTAFDTDTVHGQGSRATAVTLPFRGDSLNGGELERRLDAWVKQGVIEPSARDAVVRVAEHPEWLDLSDQTIVLLGAASEMGPLEHLAAWGATVVAVDLPHDRVWERIDTAARAGSGRVLRPMRNGRPGADLLAQLSDVKAWLDQIEGPLTIGNYVYADGANFLRLAAAVDALVADRADTGGLQAYAYLATPTDVYAVPEEIARDTSTRRTKTVASSAIRAATRGALYDPQYGELIEGEDGRKWGIADGLVPIQGANYALAKQIQRWRAIATHNGGVRTSANVAPATRTISVTKNRMLAAAYRAAHAYGVEIFEPETSRALMALLLVHDLRHRDVPSSTGSDLTHPYDHFVDQASHGGLWRMGYEPRSVLPVALLRGLVRRNP